MGNGHILPPMSVHPPSASHGPLNPAYPAVNKYNPNPNYAMGQSPSYPKQSAPSMHPHQTLQSSQPVHPHATSQAAQPMHSQHQQHAPSSGHPQHPQHVQNKPSLPQHAAPAANPDQSPFRPLNVKDALTYLDQVKFQFGDQPEIYNRFLEVMKDFKSQAYVIF